MSFLFLMMGANDVSYKEQTVGCRTAKRCVNLDWLEVFTHEPVSERRDAAYYRSKGYVVHERDYGTRVYREMFSIEGTDGELLLEVRRHPASSGLNGIHQPNECHIRLTNRTCYFDGAAAALKSFLLNHGYFDTRISRVDVCLDFVVFDRGDDPQAFVRRYIRRKYAKINQGRISAHGEDTWCGQSWNSLSWGSKSSPVSTKMYNKTMELLNVKDNSFGKPYIRQAWQVCGLVDDWQKVTKDGSSVNVWRVEFSVRSAVKNWVRIELDGGERKFQSLHNTLDCYDTRGKLLVIFASLAAHYFHFKKFRKNQRKDRCPDKVLFDFKEVEQTYKIECPSTVAGAGAKYKQKYAALIAKIREYQTAHAIPEIFKACEVLIESMKDDDFRADLVNPYSREEKLMMQQLLALRLDSPNITVSEAMGEIKELLGITDRTIRAF